MSARNSAARKLLVLVALVAVGAAACGSSSKSATSTTPTSPAGSQSNTATTTAGGGATPTTQKLSGDSGSNFCELARHYTDANSKDIATDTPPELKKLYQNLAPELEHAEAIAPSAIKPDFATFVTFFKKLDSTLAAADYNYENLNPTAFASLDTPALTAASAHVSQYMAQVCHIATPTT